ncbi:MAG: SCP2 sterol-binding domain-containing protein [Gammaproteobacteria bacterium]
MKLPAAVLAGLEIALNRCLALDPETLSRLESMTGKIVAVELRGLGVTLHMAPHGGGIQLLRDYAGTADAVISGAPLSLARVGLGEERGLLFAGAVEINGDVSLGQHFEAVLRDMDIDWEEQLSRLVGDVAAHQVGNLVRDTLEWGAKSMDSLGRDMTEYLQEESRHLPQRDEVNEFLAAVDVLRDDTERLEARVKRLRGRLESNEP